MARCASCDYKWSIRDIWSLGFSKGGKPCPNCGKTQYISGKTQKIFTLGYLSLLFTIVLPFIITLSNVQEDLYD
ncbi:hypothetical protein N781_16010 [Pontibacillus halophilus JSM 076056 = DSM 19796]|uniref:CXXC-20-CXXC protein n=1 Tax=Pontibacillus halophilus JSM 076056 = DSM 19796 TaxID=1385510 RepID=A0A0A5GET3_9BACI|nr:hypothetical protein N781_16010 [Pontibacillus halophilus JSM 076056 = DSM 19796]